MIEAAIFDMDGVLIDSEPFWKQSEIQAYSKVGVELTTDMVTETTGLDCTSSVKYWYDRYKWTSKSVDEVKNYIEYNVEQLILAKGEVNKGVIDLFDLLKQNNIRIALASSSHLKLIEAVITKLQIKHYFEVYHSSEFEVSGKPHPAVYIATAKKLNVNPSNCLVFEDSINGMKAGVAAGMNVVVMPDKNMYHKSEFDAALLKIDCLTSFTQIHIDKVNQKTQNEN